MATINSEETARRHKLKEALTRSLFVKPVHLNLDHLRKKEKEEEALASPDFMTAAGEVNLDELAGLDDIERTLNILTTAAGATSDQLVAIQPVAPSEQDRWRHELKMRLVKELSKSSEGEQIRRIKGEPPEPMVRAFFEKILSEEHVAFTTNQRALFVSELVDEAIGFGPLSPLLRNPDISEIMVNGPWTIFIERGGGLTLSDQKFHDDDHLMHVISNIAARMGRQIDLANPILEARLPDGSRVQAVIPPLAIDGPSITIRKFTAKTLQMEDMIQFGALTTEMAYFLGACVKARLNILVAGGTGTGKTTVLNVLSTLVQPGQRMITIEDAAELKVKESHPHVVRLETRTASSAGGGKGGVTIRDLVRSSLRMRPDRVIVGECRGGEAMDMLQAMNTGHDGSMTTAHANSAREMLQRLETMCLMAGIEMPVMAIRGQIASAIELVVHLKRYPDGSRKISEICETRGVKDGEIQLRRLFWYEVKTRGKDGRVNGEFCVTDEPPSFVHKFEAEGLNFPYEIFKGGALSEDNSMSQISNVPVPNPDVNPDSAPIVQVYQSFAVDLNQIGFAAAWVMGVLSGWGIASERLPEAELAVAEAAGNVARHSGLKESGGVMSLSISADPLYFTITIIDEGNPFNPVEAEIKERTGDTEHGMGISLIRGIVDDLSYEYRDGANRLSMKLLRHKKPLIESMEAPA